VSLDHDHLRALAATIDTGSFELAAARLHLTPSAISQRIKGLETAAGRTLVRRTKPSAVTEAGQPYLRLARQIDVLINDVLGDPADDRVSMPLAVNSDSLSTWVLPALASLDGAVAFDLHREDEDHSAELLRAGSVMAAITTDSRAVRGCTATRLGLMRYRPMASPSFARRWFAEGVSRESLANAPLVTFDRKDELQDRYLRTRTGSRLTPPRHYVPGSADFANAIRLGLGWGMLPYQQVRLSEEGTDLIDVDPGHYLDVVLYWQQWRMDTPTLSRVTEAVRAAASEHLQ